MITMNDLKGSGAKFFGAGSGSSGPVSWNDLTDRPFYENKTVLYEFPLQELTFALNETMGGMVVSVVEIPQKVDTSLIGKRAEVRFGNYNFVCEVKESPVGLALGNFSMMGAGEDTGEPFVIMIAPEGVNIVTTWSPDTWEVSITIMDYEIVPIPSKYLGEVIVTITEDDEGNLVADYHGDELTALYKDGRKIIANTRFGYIPVTQVFPKYPDSYFFNFAVIDAIVGVGMYTYTLKHKEVVFRKFSLTEITE